MGRINPPGARSDWQGRVAMVFSIGHQSKIVENIGGDGWAGEYAEKHPG